VDRDEAIRLLKGGEDGVREWNQRRGQGEEIPDLSEADLSRAVLHGADLGAAVLRRADLGAAVLRRADLRGAVLSGADLRGAVLREAVLLRAVLHRADLRGAVLRRADFREAVLSAAVLRGADLSGAVLRGAVFRRADLREADLRWAALSGADLSGADLREADLREADLSRADLSEAVLSEAQCSATIFGGVDLSEAKGLESIRHAGPSTVGVDTLLRSRGRIPEAFLRGCGVPDAQVAYLLSLFRGVEPIQFYSCFISYSTKDQDFAERLHSRMRDKGLRVWFAPEDMQPGKKMHEQVDEAIRLYDKLLLVLSVHSIGSKWVRDEIRRARRAEVREGQRKLFPIRLMDYGALKRWESFYADLAEDVAEEVREYFIPDFSNWKDHDTFEAEFDRLLRALKAAESTGEGVGPEGPPPRP
jgi:hypothetical protein